MTGTHAYQATVRWTGNTGSGTSGYKAYARTHEIAAGDKPPIAGSADPAFRGDADRWNPEDMLVGSIAACHMLWFLHLACRAGYIVERYVDEAVGVLDKTWMSRVTLRPAVTFSGKKPSAEEHRALHEQAHEKCFIANSVKTDVRVEPC